MDPVHLAWNLKKLGKNPELLGFRIFCCWFLDPWNSDVYLSENAGDELEKNQESIQLGRFKDC